MLKWVWAEEWAEVAQANPEVILTHRFYDGDDGEQKVEMLKRHSELKHTDAVRNNRIYILGMKKVFPGIDNVETALQMSKWFEDK